MTELSDGQQTIDAALAGLSNWKQDFGEFTSVLSTTQWVIAAALLVLAIIIGFLVGKDTEAVDENENQNLNFNDNQKEELSKNELEHLSKQLQERDSELKDAKEEAELTLLQLHQAQEALEQLLLESKDVPKQEIEQLRQQLETRNSEFNQLQQQLDSRNNEYKEAREEAELTLLQLHQVQEELEHYFLESRDLQKKMDSVNTISPLQQAQLQRIKSKLLKLFLAMPQMAKVNQAQIADIPQINQLLLRQQKSLRRFEALSSKP